MPATELSNERPMKFGRAWRFKVRRSEVKQKSTSNCRWNELELRRLPPGQEERPGWLFMVEEFYLPNLNHHPVCAFGAATPPGQEGQSALFQYPPFVDTTKPR